MVAVSMTVSNRGSLEHLLNFARFQSLHIHVDAIYCLSVHLPSSLDDSQLTCAQVACVAVHDDEGWVVRRRSGFKSFKSSRIRAGVTFRGRGWEKVDVVVDCSVLAGCRWSCDGAQAAPDAQAIRGLHHQSRDSTSLTPSLAQCRYCSVLNFN